MKHKLTRRALLQSALVGAATTALAPGGFAAETKGIQFAKEPKSPQPGVEAAHTPAITLEKLDSQGFAFGKTPAGDFYRVTIQAKHEATLAHHVFGIALYVNDELVAEHRMLESKAEASLPAASFIQRLQVGDQLLAVTSCNLHGQWGHRTSV